MDIKFKLPIERVFYFAKNGEYSLLVANKNCTKFRTLEQLMEIKGETLVRCVDVGTILLRTRMIKDKFISELNAKKYIDKNGQLKKKMKSKEYQDYAEMLKEKDIDIMKVIGDANLYLKNIDLGIDMNANLVKLSTQENIVSSAEVMSNNSNRNYYFLSTGELLQQAKNDHYRYFRSIGELLRYEQKLQETRGKSVVSKERIQKNTEKYLESF